MSDPGRPNASLPTVPDNTSLSSKPPTEVAKDVAVIFLAGVAIVLGLLLVTYLLMVIMDRYCCCLPGWHAVGEVTEIDHGPVARKAGLWGLRLEERLAILERILVGKAYTPDMTTISDEENPTTIAPNITEETSESHDDDDNPERVTMDEGRSNGEEEEEKEEIGEDGNNEGELDNVSVDEANHDVVCAICLAEYVEGEMVLTGTSCNHLFHTSCAFEWLSKHDHCPYCRKEMVKADEMRTAAEDLLGQDRVLEMRMWGPTEELMRNDFEEESDAPVASNTTELTQSQPSAGVALSA